MVAPTLKMVTTTATITAPTLFADTDTGNSEINTTTKLDFGVINNESDAWGPVKVAWAYVTNMNGNSAIANMGFFVDGPLGAGMTHYDKITGVWENPAAVVNVQQSGSIASAIIAVNKHTVNRSDNSNTMTSAGQHSQYIFTQWNILAIAATGQKTTGPGTGRAVFSFTYS